MIGNYGASTHDVVFYVECKYTPFPMASQYNNIIGVCCLYEYDTHTHSHTHILTHTHTQAGGVGCGIYATNNPETCHYVADNCSASVIFAENKAQLAKILQVSRPSHL